MKTKFLVTILYFFIMIPSVFSECQTEYMDKMEECNKGIEDFLKQKPKKMIPGSAIQTIIDFPCLQTTPEKRLYQIILDTNFKKIDEQMEDYLKKLYNDKSVYFGKDAEFNYIDGVNHIYIMGDYFHKLYKEQCEKTLQETFDCMEDEKTKKTAISIKGAATFLKGGDGNCYKLAEISTQSFLQVAYNGLLLNREQISRDQKKLYQQKERSKYDELLDVMTKHIGYIERLWKKWTVKIKNVY